MRRQLATFRQDRPIATTLPNRPRARRPVVGAAVILVLSLGMWAAGVAPLAGQFSDASRVEPGDSVRVRLLSALPVDASFLEWRGDAMIFEVQGLGSDWPVSVSDMSSLSVYTDRSPREGFRHGAVLGAVGGLFFGAAIGLALNWTGVIDDPEVPSKLMTDGMRWAGLGLVAGAMSYGFYRGGHPGRGWVQIALPGR